MLLAAIPRFVFPAVLLIAITGVRLRALILVTVFVVLLSAVLLMALFGGVIRALLCVALSVVTAARAILIVAPVSAMRIVRAAQAIASKGALVTRVVVLPLVLVILPALLIKVAVVAADAIDVVP
jgi:hypothetical protein